MSTLSYELRPSAVAGLPGLAAWSTAVATVAAWPQTEPLQPVLERRLARAGRSGPLREIIQAGLSDPLGLTSPDEVRRDVAELLRPLRRSLALRPLGPSSTHARLDDAEQPFVVELRELDPVIPEGRHALQGLFDDLCAGLEALPGPVALTIRVRPADVHAVEDEEAEAPTRSVRFSLRMSACVPLPASLRARAEALCLSRSSTAGSWVVAAGSRHAGPPALPGVAAVLMALGSSASLTAQRVVEGAPLAGSLPRSGAPLGRVRRMSGRTASWRLDWDSRRHHTFVAGASGCGKSTTLLRLVVDDLAAGRMVLVLDPHGDLAADVVAHAGPGDVVVIDPRDPRSAPLDLLDADPGRATAHLMSAVGEVWPADFAGPVWQRGISLSLRVLAARRDHGPTTLAELERYFVDGAWRDGVIGQLTGALRHEAEHEAAAWAGRSSSDTSAVSWLSGKLTPLTRGPAAALFHRAAARPLELELRDGRAQVMTLPLGELGPDTTRLVGRMVLARLTTAIAAQGVLPEALRRPVSIVIDEAHLFAGPALAGLFAQARKFHVSITVATQSPSALGPHLGCILTNAQTLLLGRLPVIEARVLHDRAGDETLATLPTLPRHHLVVVPEEHRPDSPPMILTPIRPPTACPTASCASS
jgi:hypothetical protein